MMKKLNLPFTLLFVLFQLFSQAQGIKNGQILKNVNGLNIIIDKRVEMITVIQYLADSKLVNYDKYAYTDHISKYFEPYKNHKVVALYKELESLKFEYDVPVHAMLFLDTNFCVVKKFDKELIDRGTFGEKRLYDFALQLQDFNNKTNFDKFFRDNYSILYKSIELVVDSSLSNFDEINNLEKFYGYKQHSYNVILSVLENKGCGYGVRMTANNGQYDVYDVIGTLGNPVNDVAFFGTEQNFTGMVWHEFGHSFVNPLVDKYYKQFDKYKALQKPIIAKMSSQNYDSWKFILHEHIVRAIGAVMTYKKYGKNDAEKLLDRERTQGFIYIDSLYSKILTYSQYRKEANFKEFFPQLIEVMKEYSKNPIDYKYIPAPNELLIDSNLIIIYPTGESSDSINNAIKSSIINGNKKYYHLPDDKLIPDTIALKRNLKDYNIICFGTYKGNVWLRTKIKNLPIEIYDDKIIAKQSINQSDLIVIASWINPDNPEKNIVIYTAQQPQLIYGDVRIMTIGNNYLIVNRNSEVIEWGMYTYANGKFIVK